MLLSHLAALGSRIPGAFTVTMGGDPGIGEIDDILSVKVFGVAGGDFQSQDEPEYGRILFGTGICLCRRYFSFDGHADNRKIMELYASPNILH